MSMCKNKVLRMSIAMFVLLIILIIVLLQNKTTRESATQWDMSELRQQLGIPSAAADSFEYNNAEGRHPHDDRFLILRNCRLWSKEEELKVPAVIIYEDSECISHYVEESELEQMNAQNQICRSLPVYPPLRIRLFERRPGEKTYHEVPQSRHKSVESIDLFPRQPSLPINGGGQ